MKCNRFVIPALFSLFSVIIAVDFLWGIMTALQVAFINIIAMSVLQLATSGYEEGPKRDGYVIGAFTFSIINLGVLGDRAEGFILTLVLTGVVLCIYEFLWFELWAGNRDGKSHYFMWLLSIVGIFYLVYLEGIKPLLSAVFFIVIILAGYIVYKRVK